jgi:hypothetical protein
MHAVRVRIENRHRPIKARYQWILTCVTLPFLFLHVFLSLFYQEFFELKITHELEKENLPQKVQGLHGKITAFKRD